MCPYDTNLSGIKVVFKDAGNFDSREIFMLKNKYFLVTVNDDLLITEVITDK